MIRTLTATKSATKSFTLGNDGNVNLCNLPGRERVDGGGEGRGGGKHVGSESMGEAPIFLPTLFTNKYNRIELCSTRG